MDARKSEIFSFQFVKPILQTINTPKKIQCLSISTPMVLEIWSWSVKRSTFTARYSKNFEYFHSFPSSGMQAIAVVRPYEKNHFKMPLNVFNTQYTYSNFVEYRLLHCWKII